MTRDRNEAAEAADAALCSAWEKLEQLNDPRYADDVLPAVRSTETAVMQEEAVRLLAQLLKELSPEQRQAVYYCRILGWAPSELARLLQTDTHTVSARLYRGLRTLQ